MECMDLIKCSKCQSVKSCCCDKTKMDCKHESIESKNEDFVFVTRENKVGNVQSFANSESMSITNTQNERYEEPIKVSIQWTTNRKDSMYRPSSELSYDMKDSSQQNQGEIFSSLQTGQDKDFRCPRCGKRMQEPRLLPCLHPICSSCVSEFMNKSLYNSTRERIRETQSKEGTHNFFETCTLCDFRLPSPNSTIPPPHYPLQHRLVMDAIRCRLANRVLCDACPDEVVAVVQCSTCLRNFCSDCGMEHEQQITMELKPSEHTVKPLWEATKVRRTAFCQKHPTHALRFYCIACQQVTCKECMWSIQHRGHASESATGAGKSATLYLTTLLQRAKTLLSILLTQYNRDVFSNNTIDELEDTLIPTDSRYVGVPYACTYFIQNLLKNTGRQVLRLLICTVG